MRLNLGCGPDLREGYVNVDARPGADLVVDLSKFPWPWPDDSVEQILMLDFLEHFSYRKTDKILEECWRVLMPSSEIIIQVPDFEECAKAVLRAFPFDCNKCEKQIIGNEGLHAGDPSHVAIAHDECPYCGHQRADSDDAALNRLYGGQDYEGNWHHTAFTKSRMRRYLERNGFVNFQDLEIVHQRINWNFKMSATKGMLRWD